LLTRNEYQHTKPDFITTAIIIIIIIIISGACNMQRA